MEPVRCIIYDISFINSSGYLYCNPIFLGIDSRGESILAGLMAGMVITETIFTRKGIGWWMARAALQLDVSAIMFNVLFLGTVFVVVNLVVDLIYAAIDPRIRLS